MEGEAPEPLEFMASGYAITIVLDNDRLIVRAYSSEDEKMFEAVIQDNDLSETDKFACGNCEGVYYKIEECIGSYREVLFNDIGELKFPYLVGAAKKQMERTLDLKLRQV